MGNTPLLIRVLGYPIRTSSDHSSVDNSPRPIAVSHVLHRLLVPRHPPCALKHFTTTRCSHPLCNTQQTTTPQPPPTPPTQQPQKPERGPLDVTGQERPPKKKHQPVSPQDPTACQTICDAHKRAGFVVEANEVAGFPPSSVEAPDLSSLPF